LLPPASLELEFDLKLMFWNLEARVTELYGYALNALRAYQPLVVSETRPTVHAFIF